MKRAATDAEFFGGRGDVAVRRSECVSNQSSFYLVQIILAINAALLGGKGSVAPRTVFRIRSTIQRFLIFRITWRHISDSTSVNS